MKKSKYSLVVENSYLFNTLWGSLEKIDSAFLDKWENFSWDNFTLAEKETLIKRKHVIKTSETIINYGSLNQQSQNISRFYIIFSYNCNLNCPYCFEKNIKNKKTISENELDNIFNSITKIIEMRKSEYNEIILFGGEPFLLKNIKSIKKTLEFAKNNKIYVSAISNGTNVLLYKKLIKEYRNIFKWFSITMDGDKKLHDSRRIGLNGESTFEKILKNIDFLVKEKIIVSIRINIDKTNMDCIPSFLNLIKGRYDSNLEVSLSLVEDNTKVGNKDLLTYEEITTILNNLNLFNANQKIELNIKPVKKINDLLHKPNNITPLFKYCWIGSYFTFSPNGNIYVCPESCENENLKIGEYYPDIQINKNKIAYFSNINALTMNECKDCAFAPICGGGCYLKRITTNETYCNKNDIYKSLVKQIKALEMELKR